MGVAPAYPTNDCVAAPVEDGASVGLRLVAIVAILLASLTGSLPLQCLDGQGGATVAPTLLLGCVWK